VTDEVEGRGPAQCARWTRWRGVRPRLASGTGIGAAATGERRGWSCAAIEVGGTRGTDVWGLGHSAIRPGQTQVKKQFKQFEFKI
jgi:hypothetical protein